MATFRRSRTSCFRGTLPPSHQARRERRAAARELNLLGIEVVGRLPRSLFTTEEVWLHPNGRNLYLGTGSGGDRLYAVDVSDPANPVVTDSLVVNTRRVNDIEHPDVCVFDLDPLTEDAEDVRRAALALRDYLDELELPEAHARADLDPERSHGLRGRDRLAAGGQTLTGHDARGFYPAHVVGEQHKQEQRNRQANAHSQCIHRPVGAAPVAHQIDQRRRQTA